MDLLARRLHSRIHVLVDGFWSLHIVLRLRTLGTDVSVKNTGEWPPLPCAWGTFWECVQRELFNQVATLRHDTLSGPIPDCTDWKEPRREHWKGQERGRGQENKVKAQEEIMMGKKEWERILILRIWREIRYPWENRIIWGQQSRPPKVHRPVLTTPADAPCSQVSLGRGICHMAHSLCISLTT